MAAFCFLFSVVCYSWGCFCRRRMSRRRRHDQQQSHQCRVTQNVSRIIEEFVSNIRLRPELCVTVCIVCRNDVCVFESCVKGFFDQRRLRYVQWCAQVNVSRNQKSIFRTQHSESAKRRWCAHLVLVGRSVFGEDLNALKGWHIVRESVDADRLWRSFY